MRTRAMAWRSVLFLCGVAVAAAGFGLLEMRGSEARDGDTVSLLVKCDRRKVPSVVRSLTALGAQVYDLESLGRLDVPPPPATSTSTARLALPDAGRCMTEIYKALSSVDRKKLGSYFLIEEMIVQERRAIVRIVVDDSTVFDEVRRLFAASPYFRARAQDPQRMVELGAMQTLPGGRKRQSFQFRFALGGLEPPTAGSHAGEISLRTVKELTAEAGLHVTYAGPEQDDPNRGKGFRTISREFTFAPCRLAQLTSFLTGVTASPAGMTMIELRWKLADPKERKPADLVKKPVVKLAIRLPLER